MTAKEILVELKPLGRESYKRVLSNNHGVKEPFFGVPVSELKKFQKRIKKNYHLALDLYETGNYDAMYLAGLIADDARMSTRTCSAGRKRLMPDRWPATLWHGLPPGVRMARRWP
jgi:hypothetical protein